MKLKYDSVGTDKMYTLFLITFDLTPPRFRCSQNLVNSKTVIFGQFERRDIFPMSSPILFNKV